MRKLNISPPRLVFVAGVALLCACHKSENEQIFDKLDRVIAKKHLYEERFVRHADSLRRVLRAAGDDTLRWQTANRLFDSYITYNIDTAARYVGLMHNYADATGSREMKFLSTTCDVSVLIARNNIEEAYERILSLDTVGITRRMRASYYTQQMVVFGRLASGDGSEARRKVYADSLFRLRHTRIGFDGHSRVTRQRMYALELMDLNRYDEALEVLLPLYDPAKYNSRTLARIAYNIANAYYLLGDVEQHKYWLATAAICDLQTPVREYLSLYNLALLMFEQQDMERAARYIQCTMADMLACNYNTRILHSSQAEMIINQAVVYRINSRSRILTVMINIFMGLFVIIVLLFTFKSVGLSILLIIVIQSSIWINFSVPYLTSSNLFFISYLIVSAIQMGGYNDKKRNGGFHSHEIDDRFRHSRFGALVPRDARRHAAGRSRPPAAAGRPAH